MTRFQIAGVLLLVVLGAVFLNRVSDHVGAPPKKAEPVPTATGMAEGSPDTVDPKTGNMHLTIPVVASSKPKP